MPVEKRFIRPSPGELERRIREEKERRRKLRWQQVRQQSKVVAKNVRESVRKEEEVQIRRIGMEELERYREQKTVELAILEEEYQQCLHDIGIGYEGVEELENYSKWLEERNRRNAEVAEIRGKHAMAKLMEEKELQEKLKENKIGLRKSAVLAEKLRAAKLRKKPLVKQKKDNIEVVEFDGAHKEQKAVLRDRRCFVSSPGSTTKPVVRRIPLKDVGNGLDAAVREQEEEAVRRVEKEKLALASKRRAEEALRKERRPYLYTPDGSRDSVTPRDSRVSSSMSRVTDDDMDLVPVRGPSGNTSRSSTVSSNQSLPGPREAVAKFSQQTVHRHDHYDRHMDLYGHHGHRMGGVGSAFSVVGDQVDEATRRIFERAEEQRRMLQESVVTSDETVVRSNEMMKKTVMKSVQGGGTGSKNRDADKEFIARVLNFDESREVAVKIDIEEFSESSVSHATSASEFSSTSATATEFSSNISICSSTTDITQERFWREPRITDYGPIHGLIDELKTRGSDKRQKELRSYIERLLEMKREEIDELSVTGSSFSSGTYSGTGGTYSGTGSTYGGTDSGTSLSISKGSASNVGSSFVASTPASILASSSSNSSRSTLPKTVRFKEDKEDNTLLSASVYQEHNETIRTVEDDIRKRTETSLEDLQRIYIAKREEIVRQLMATRMKIVREEEKDPEVSEKDPEVSEKDPDLSEGPLSSSSSWSGEGRRGTKDYEEDTTHKESSESSAGSSPGPGAPGSPGSPPATKYRLGGVSRRQILESSSGTTTTSSSSALAELKAKLLNLEAKIEASGGESFRFAEEEFSSFRLGTEEPEAEVSHITLSSDEEEK